MGCKSPLKAWKPKTYVDGSGGEYVAPGKGVTFSSADAYDVDSVFYLPCGKCQECRILYAQGWAIRCHHEAQIHEQNCFLTMTYDEEALAKRGHGVLDKDEIDRFLGRLRRKLRYANDDRVNGLKYLYAGEYGGKSGRLHYHMLLFGWEPDDKEVWSKTKLGDFLYMSESLNDLWGYGMVHIGTVTYASAGYVARYCVKKRGDANEMNDAEMMIYQKTYATKNVELLGDGDVPWQPEFINASRKPPIGWRWLEQYWRDVFPQGFVVIDGFKLAAPKSYWKWLEQNHIDVFDEAKDIRIAHMVDAVKKNSASELELRQRQRAFNAKTERLLNRDFM